MAKKKSTKKSSMRPKPEAAHKLAEAALHLAARQGWQRITFDDVARAAKLSPAAAKTLFADKNSLLSGIVALIDTRLAEAVGQIDSQASAHDRLFEVLMARFDILQTHRRAILGIMGAARRNPQMLRHLLPAQVKAMRAMLRLAAIEPERIHEPLVIAGLLSIFYGIALCVWRRDASEDMTKTMAALDRGLRRASSIAAVLLRLT